MLVNYHDTIMSFSYNKRNNKEYLYFHSGTKGTLYLSPKDNPSKVNVENIKKSLGHILEIYFHHSNIQHNIRRKYGPKNNLIEIHSQIYEFDLKKLRFDIYCYVSYVFVDHSLYNSYMTDFHKFFITTSYHPYGWIQKHLPRHAD
jgi:hypothetical protein